jgi:transposase-like protein
LRNLRSINHFAPWSETGDIMNREVKQIEFKDEFKDCPECGYKDGFHSIFKKNGNKTKWLFICPSCHSVFDIGFTV